MPVTLTTMGLLKQVFLELKVSKENQSLGKTRVKSFEPKQTAARNSPWPLFFTPLTLGRTSAKRQMLQLCSNRSQVFILPCPILGGALGWRIARVVRMQGRAVVTWERTEHAGRCWRAQTGKGALPSPRTRSFHYTGPQTWRFKDDVTTSPPAGGAKTPNTFKASFSGHTYRQCSP